MWLICRLIHRIDGVIFFSSCVGSRVSVWRWCSVVRRMEDLCGDMRDEIALYGGCCGISEWHFSVGAEQHNVIFKEKKRHRGRTGRT